MTYQFLAIDMCYVLFLHNVIIIYKNEMICLLPLSVYFMTFVNPR